MNQADHYIDRVQHLPPAPRIITQLLGLFHDPDGEIDRVVELISHDPGLTAEMLKRCNSACFGGGRPTASISEAVGRLGFNEVYSVVVALTGSRVLAMNRTGGIPDPGWLWKHSVTSAVAAGTLARWVHEPEAEAFTAGLLHDLGKQVLASTEPVAYAEVIRNSGVCGLALTKAEEAAFGVTHAQVGARLLSRWGLPPGIAHAVVQHHHEPAAATPSEERLAVLVYLANEAAHCLAGEIPIGTELSPGQICALNGIRAAPDQFPEILDQVRDGVQRLERLLGFKV